VSVSVFVNQKRHTAQAAKVAEVRITPKGFEPATLVVKRGTRIAWINTDSKLHQVVSNPYPKGGDLPDLKSEILNDGQTYTYTANKFGSFGYHDQMRPTFNGTITIQK
jgi:plastocyanin